MQVNLGNEIIEGRVLVDAYLTDLSIINTETGMEWDVKEEYLKLYDESHETQQAILVYALFNAAQNIIQLEDLADFQILENKEDE